MPQSDPRVVMGPPASCPTPARETRADPALPTAFKRAAGEAGPTETHELLRLWHKARRSNLKSRQHLLNEAENLRGELPEELRAAQRVELHT